MLLLLIFSTSRLYWGFFFHCYDFIHMLSFIFHMYASIFWINLILQHRSNFGYVFNETWQLANFILIKSMEILEHTWDAHGIASCKIAQLVSLFCLMDYSIWIYISDLVVNCMTWLMMLICYCDWLNRYKYMNLQILTSKDSQKKDLLKFHFADKIGDSYYF